MMHDQRGLCNKNATVACIIFLIASQIVKSLFSDFTVAWVAGVVIGLLVIVFLISFLIFRYVVIMYIRTLHGML